VLERKAKIYEKLKKGKTGGLTEAQYDALLVDVSACVFGVRAIVDLRMQFDSKDADRYESDSDDVDESLTVPVAPEDVRAPSPL
jgi:hypothetical protein